MPRTDLQNIQRRFPKDTIVKYVGHRLPERVGQLARVIDYKDANGLYVIWTADQALGSVTPGAVKPQ